MRNLLPDAQQATHWSPSYFLVENMGIGEKVALKQRYKLGVYIMYGPDVSPLMKHNVAADTPTSSGNT